MIRVGETNLAIGGRSDFLSVGEDPAWARLNVAKTVHGQILRRTPKRGDPNYIFFEDPQRRLMSVNWVDAPSPRLFDWTGPDGIMRMLDFIEEQMVQDKDVLVSCDQGISRAPTVGLLCAAKRLQIIDSTSFDSARTQFLPLYPMYRPSGIGRYAAENWQEIK